jgi:hypothetical protein
MKTGLQRDTTDAFYTLPSVALSCINYFHKNVIPSKDDIFIEPSAGSGAFSSQLKGRNIYSFDILPQKSSIVCQDFLLIKQSPIYHEIISMKKPIHVIGNPPFGRQAKTARSFIRLCSEFASSISFILPKSFKKQSFQKTFPLNFHLLFEIDLPEGSFTIDEKLYSVPCVFQVWKNMQHERIVQTLMEPVGFIFCKKNENPDMAIRRVGVYAGKLLEQNLQSLSGESHYFLRLTTLTPVRFKSLYNKISFEHNNTVGPKSISKQEILQKILPL